MRNFLMLCSSLWLLANSPSLVLADRPQDQPPNIIHIFVDDMGWGSIGAYGSEIISTPHLDQLAADGMMFDRAYAATVCAPSRGMLKTGFHNGHTFIDRNANIGEGFREQDVTVGDVLSDAGYRTSVFGKWGFGGGHGQSGALRAEPNIQQPTTLPQNQGYEHFHGFLSHSRAHSFWVDSLWTTEEPEEGLKYRDAPDHGLWLESTGNTEQTPHAVYSMDAAAWKSEAYVREQAQQGEPFYVQLNHQIPHFDIDAIADAGALKDLDGNEIAPAGLGIYEDDERLTPRARMHAAMITRMDASIGSLMRALENPSGDGDTSDSILDNTIIIFTSDNGPSPEDGLGREGLLNLDATGGLRGGKRDLFEGGIRVPQIVRWDGHVEPGSRTALPTDLADFLPTAAEFAGTRGPVGMDGVSLMPTLTGEGIQRHRDYLLSVFHENWAGPDSRHLGLGPARWAITRNNIKLIQFADGGQKLYDLANDPGEENPIDIETHQSMVDDLTAIALAEGVEKPDGYAVEYAQWTGSDGASVSDSQNWSNGGSPTPNWSAAVVNHDSDHAVAYVHAPIETLGFEVRGEEGRQTVIVEHNGSLSGRNELRIAGQGRLHLDDAQLHTNRWIDVLDDGELTGHGTIIGHLYNAARVAPGRADELPDPEAMATDVDTGVVTAVDFEFTGQDQSPMTSTATLHEHVVLLEGMTFGPGVQPRHADGGSTDAGDEFNVAGHDSSSLDNAISRGDYLQFTIAPVRGVAMSIDQIDFELWRNGSNAATDFALLTSQEGFESSHALGMLSDVTDAGSDNRILLEASGMDSEATTDAVQVRFYAWGAGNEYGNTHVTDATVQASFASVPTEPLSPQGVLTLVGNYTQLASGYLEIDLAGTESGTFDALHVMGNLELDGTLHIHADDGYSPSEGDEFQVLKWDGKLDGTFSDIQAFDLDSGLAWDFDRLYTDGTITVVPEPTSLLPFSVSTVWLLAHMRTPQ